MIQRFSMTLAIAAVAAGPVLAQDSLPTSTNPAERVIYRGEKTDQEQMNDQLECYRYSTAQVEWDPEPAYAQLKADHGAALDQYNSTQGAAVGGAARGALAGLAIGAIAGDAGTGAAIGATAGGLGGARRGRRARGAAEAGFEEAAAEFKTNFIAWDRNWTACMEARGYGIS